eukprot:192233-Rhodomonas_salina.1
MALREDQYQVSVWCYQVEAKLQGPVGTMVTLMVCSYALPTPSPVCNGKAMQRFVDAELRAKNARERGQLRYLPTLPLCNVRYSHALPLRDVRYWHTMSGTGIRCSLMTVFAPQDPMQCPVLSYAMSGTDTRCPYAPSGNVIPASVLCARCCHTMCGHAMP